MIKVFGIIIGALLCIVIALLVVGSWVLIIDNKRLKKRNKKKEEEIKQNEIQNRINNEAKESMETGNNSTDFDTTISILSKLKGEK